MLRQLFFLLILILPLQMLAGRCTGSANCTACKNCSACKYCNEGGGTCGVCSGGNSSNQYTYPTSSQNSTNNNSPSSAYSPTPSTSTSNSNARSAPYSSTTGSSDGWKAGIAVTCLLLFVFYFLRRN